MPGRTRRRGGEGSKKRCSGKASEGENSTPNVCKISVSNADKTSQEKNSSPVSGCADANHNSAPTLSSVSAATGLVVARVRHAVPGHLVTAQERGQLARLLPGVILLNTVSDESVLVGLDCPPDQVAAAVAKLGKEASHWVVTLEDVSGPGQDPFSFFRGWPAIPRVDKNGMYSLIVNLRMRDKTKLPEMEERRKLLSMLKPFNVAKTMHGDGETMVQVSHVLEFVAYSDHIEKVYNVERRHTWQPRPTSGQAADPGLASGEARLCWVRVTCPELRQLTPAHKQFTVHQHLARLGSVLQLEHNLLGVPDIYLAVFSSQETLSCADLDPQLFLVELSRTSLPDSALPIYGVDGHGFYTVSGTFPGNCGMELRNQFSADMKNIGAVGFKSGESGEEFSLHFVNSHSLVQVTKLSQYTSFNLKICSPLIKMAKSKNEEKSPKLVPTILRSQVKNINIESTKANLKTEVSKKTPPMQSIVKEPNFVKNKEESSIQKVKASEDVCNKISKEGEKLVLQDVQFASTDIRYRKSPIAPKKVVEVSSIQITEADVMKINWEMGKSPSQASKAFGKFFSSLGDVHVSTEEGSQNVVFKVQDSKKLIRSLKLYSRPETNTLQKLQDVKKPRFVLKESSGNKMFGLTLPKKRIMRAELKKHLSGFSGHKIDDGGTVFISWFPTRIDFYQALADPRINIGFVPCVANFDEFRSKDVKKSAPQVVPKTLRGQSKTEDEGAKKIDVAKESKNQRKNEFQLSESQIFGCVWKKPSTPSRIRDDQIISRQLTDFVKSVKCESIDQDDDGSLIFNFASQDDVNKVLSKYCPEAFKSPSILKSLTRKFTLIPWRGSFGIFTSKRIRLEDIEKLGNVKLSMCSLWFTDKMEVIRVLRDPVISSLYPALYIDCRNIYILRSIWPTGQEMSPASYYPRSSFHPGPRPAAGFRPSYLPPRPPVPMIGFHNSRLPRPRFSLQNHTSVNFRIPHRPYRSTSSVLSQMLPRSVQQMRSASSSFDNFKYDFLVGKFGVLPSDRMAREGYKEYNVPERDERKNGDCRLFFRESEQCRKKKPVDAAERVQDILSGKEKESVSLNNLKMERVELFLREKLGVEEDLEFGGGNNEPGIVIDIMNNNSASVSDRFEELADDEEEDLADLDTKSLTSDLLGLYTMIVPCTEETKAALTSSLEEDVAWFQPPVSVLPVTNPATGDTVLEVKMEDKEVTMAAFRGLKLKYPAMTVDTSGGREDIVADPATGLFTLVFTDTEQMKYAGTVARFQQYCRQPGGRPVISRGEAAQEVRLGFGLKEEAVRALADNRSNPQFPGLGVAPCSRG